VLTQCPGCQTVFRVTSTILRAAHGQVRCGRCNTQFDAIEQLQDGDDPEHPGTSTTGTTKLAVDTRPHDNGPPNAEITHEDIVLEGNRIEISGVYRASDAADVEDNPAHSRTVIEEFNIDTEEWENPFKAAAQNNDDETELEDVEQELNAASLADAIATLDASMVGDSMANNRSQTAMPVEPMHPFAALLGDHQPAAATVPKRSRGDVAISSIDDESLFATPSVTPRWRWLLASIALCVMLITQTLHHSRETLARHPSFGPQLSRLYAALGQPLSPQWQLQAYSIKQWGIVADPQQPGTLHVRASVTNGASFAQPYPLLQISLEDRFGGKVGSRAFTPQEYLASSAQATRLLAAGEAANIDLAIVDPGQNAVGFQFDSCLQLHGQLQCAHDLPTQPL
jgi:predicted Zn finger-like uncharacterized protein